MFTRKIVDNNALIEVLIIKAYSCKQQVHLTSLNENFLNITKKIELLQRCLGGINNKQNEPKHPPRSEYASLK